MDELIIYGMPATIAAVIAMLFTLLGAKVVQGVQLMFLKVDREAAEVRALTLDNDKKLADIDLIEPTANGVMRTPRKTLENVPIEQLIALMVQAIEANKAHPLPPTTLTYSPHMSADRSLDITAGNGLAQISGGGAFTLLDAIDQDMKFGFVKPKPAELEDNYADAEFHGTD